MKLLLLSFVALAFSVNAFSQESSIKTITNLDPVFPPETNNFIYGEEIKVAVRVNKNGQVTETKAWGPLVPCSNMKDPVVNAIVKAATDAAKDITFEPILKNGKPTETDLMITYRLRPKPQRVAGETPKLIQGGVLNGKALSLPKPAYPASAKSTRASGAVSVRVLIGEDGRVLSAAAVSGHPLLLEPAVESACRARFAPTLLSGQPVKVNGIITYMFIP